MLSSSDSERRKEKTVLPLSRRLVRAQLNENALLRVRLQLGLSKKLHSKLRNTYRLRTILSVP